MNKYELFFYRLYIVVEIVGVIAFLVFAANSCEQQSRIKKLQSEHSKLVSGIGTLK